jgi:ABC-type sugar transport system permease subunit
MLIQEAKSKWWYRLIKVIYTILLISIVVIGVVLIFKQNPPLLDPERSFVECDDGRIISTTELKKNNINLIGHVFNHKLNRQEFIDNIKYDNNDTKLRHFCSIGPLRQERGVNEEEISVLNQSFTPIANYKFVKFYDKQFTKIYLFVFLFVIIIVISFLIIRGIFYYIMFGKFFLKRDE